MATDTSSIDLSFGNLIAGVCGAFVSLRFVQGTLPERFSMAMGGAALSYYATTPTAHWLGMATAEGLVGFLIGLFGMAIAAKVYEAIQVLPAAQMAGDVWETIKKRLGG